MLKNTLDSTMMDEYMKEEANRPTSIPSSLLNKETKIIVEEVQQPKEEDDNDMNKNKGLRFKEPEIKFLAIGHNEYINVYNICSVTVRGLTSVVDKITMNDGQVRTVNGEMNLKIEDLLK